MWLGVVSGPASHSNGIPGKIKLAVLSTYSCRNIIILSRHKNNCQKIYPAFSVMTKRDFILRGTCFCEKYT